MNSHKNNESHNLSKINLSRNFDKPGIFIFIVIPLICIVKVPLGVLPYLCGRFNFPQIMSSIFLIVILMIICFLISSYRSFSKRNIAHRNKSYHIAGFLLSVIFFFLLIPINIKYTFWDSYSPFLCGYKDRIINKIDLNEVRSWLLLENQKYSPLNDEQVRHFIIPYDELPESLKEIANDGLIHFNQNDLGNPSLIQTCGGGMLQWGFYIRLLDKEYSDPNEWKSNWILIEPGFIVYAN